MGLAIYRNYLKTAEVHFSGMINSEVYCKSFIAKSS